MLILRLLKRNFLWLILLPALTAFTVYYLTRNMPKVYRSTATIYTGLGSGYSILSNDQTGWVSQEAINNEFDNLFTTINSQETMMRVGERLLARHLQLKKPDSLVLGHEGFQNLRLIKASLGAYLPKAADETTTYLKLDELAHAKGANPVKSLLLQGLTYYSVATIKEIKTTRKSGSDMLMMEYQAKDPAVTQATLALLIDVFRERYADFKSSEANSVVKYYSDRVRNMQNSLQQAESKLKAFGVTNKIVDYGQQTITTATSQAALTNDYNRELMEYQAAKASMNTLSKRVSDRTLTLATNDAFISKREDMVKLQTQLANARSYGQPKSIVAELEGKLNRLTSDLKSVAQQHYELGNTTESVAQRTLVDEWLKKVMAFEESAARLSVYEKQIKELDNTANQLTPLGSTLKQLNRDVDVAEKEYMETIAELNKARARQKNAEMEGPLSVLDDPDFPMEPLPSKRMMLVGAGLATGLVLALLLMLVRYLMDDRITSLERAEERTGFSMAAVFPMVGKRSAKALRASQAMLEQLRSTIAIELKNQHSPSPYTLIPLVSSRAKQGKTWLSLLLAEQYAQAGHSVVYCYPQLSAIQPTEMPNVTFVSYATGSDFIDMPDVNTLLKRSGAPRADSFDVVLLELPSLIDHAIPAHLVSQASVSVMVISAKAAWTREDVQLAALYKRAVPQSVIAVLNQVDLDMVIVPPVSRNVVPATSPAPLPSPAPEPMKTV